jgi:hypothetical protein
MNHGKMKKNVPLTEAFIGGNIQFLRITFKKLVL